MVRRCTNSSKKAFPAAWTPRAGLCSRRSTGKDFAPKAAGSTFWLTAFYGRLVAYLPEDWEAVTTQLSSIALPSPRLAHFKTKVMGLAQELTPDAQGRVRITQALMHEVGLEKDVMLVGMLSKFEIWDLARFNALSIEDVSAELAASGLNISL